MTNNRQSRQYNTPYFLYVNYKLLITIVPVKRFLFSLLITLAVSHTYAYAPFIDQWVRDAQALGYTPEVLVTDDHYTRLQMADSCYLDIVDYTDSLLVVRTVCAPVCSSVAAVYSKSGQVLRTILPPTNSVFPEAYIDSSVLLWRDNTPEILDDTERKYMEKEK